MCDIGLILLKILRPWVKKDDEFVDKCLLIEKLVSISKDSGKEKER